MCGRFFLDAKAGDIVEHYNVQPPTIFSARYNIAPTTPVLAVTNQGSTHFRWGLIPSWAKDISMGNRMFNARAETVNEKPSFKNAYKRRRCLIPASGFYEWKRQESKKQAYCCRTAAPMFSMAGVWELWQDADGNEIQSCAVLSTESTGEMAKIHHRMPVYIAPDSYQRWLDCKLDDTQQADSLLLDTKPDYQVYEVSSQVNNSRNEGVDLIRPLDQIEESFQLTP